MKFTHVIGMDMAKENYVLSIHDFKFTKEFENTPKAIRKMLKTLSKLLGVTLTECLFCFEHTGIYSMAMMVELEKQGLPFAVVSGLAIKKSLGITRGKSDRIDAQKIAEYAFFRQAKLRLFKFPSEALMQLEHLLSLRSVHVRNRAGYQARMKEQFSVLKKTHYPELFQSQKRMIKHLTKEIEKIELRINQIIETDQEINKCYALLTTITGVGSVTAWQMIVKTQCFKRFSNWRKFACYCGTAPFPNESGTMKKRARISKIGDGDMKSLLTLAARSAMLHDIELKMFCERKLKQGKSKKNVTNAVRNKLLARMFSVVKRGTPYVELYKFAS